MRHSRSCYEIYTDNPVHTSDVIESISQTSKHTK